MFTKKLIKLRKERESLWADSPIKVVNEGYPFVFERGEGKGAIVIAINPSDNEYSLGTEEVRMLISENSTYSDGKIKMGGVSLFIGEKI